FGGFLATAGHFEAAVTQADLGRKLDPFSPFAHAFAANSLAIAGRLEAAESAARLANELQADYLPALWTLGRILCRLERAAEAVPYFERAVQLSRSPFCVGCLGDGLALAGRPDEARRLLCELDERGSRGEFIQPLARLRINTGLRNSTAIRAAL